MIDHQLVQQKKLLIQKIREFFDNNDFLEVETPILTPFHDPAPHIDPFKTNFKTPNIQRPLFLNSSPELSMKKLLPHEGFEKIYQICKVFRNGELGGGRHNPEFSMLEWYRVDSNYQEIMQDTEDLIRHVAGKNEITYQNQKIDLSDFEKITINELFKKFCDIDLLENKTFELLAKKSEKLGHTTEACNDWDDIFYKIFLNEIEPHLGKERPVFVCDYPSSQAALAIKKAEEPFFAERFELYIAGHELCNAYSELTDSIEQRKRFEKDNEIRKKLGKETFEIDEEFIASLKSIHKPCGGNALGIDRLLMVLLDKTSIEEILLFPIK